MVKFARVTGVPLAWRLELFERLSNEPIACRNSRVEPFCYYIRGAGGGKNTVNEEFVILCGFMDDNSERELIAQPPLAISARNYAK